MLKDYYQLTKPGIIYGNAITVLAGFILASRGHIDWMLLLATLAGLSLVVASGCVMNNYIDRDIDGMMERTKNRALVKGTVTPRKALIYGKALAILGFGVLYFYTNLLTVAVSLVGLFVYVVVYSMWLKRRSVYGTIVGSIAGAVPPVVGYLAVRGSLDLGAIILFFILALWQMPHSFSIAIYRLSDYTKARIPVLPVKKGIRITKIHMLIYIALFIIATLMLPVFGYAGYLYFFVMTLLGLVWLWLCAKGFWLKPSVLPTDGSPEHLLTNVLVGTNDKPWARRMSIFSLVIIVAFCLLVAVDGVA